MPCGLDPSSSLLLSGLVAHSIPLRTILNLSNGLIRDPCPNSFDSDHQQSPVGPCGPTLALRSQDFPPPHSFTRRGGDRPISYAPIFYHGVLKFFRSMVFLEANAGKNYLGGHGWFERHS